MELIGVAVCVIAVAAVLFVIFAIPAVLQLKKTLASADSFLVSMEGSLKTLVEDEVKPMVRSINSTMAEVEGVAKGARQGVEAINDTLEAFRGVGNMVRSVKEAVSGSVSGLAAYKVGLMAGVLNFIQSLFSRKGKEVGQ